MNGLLALSVGLNALMGLFCILIYLRISNHADLFINIGQQMDRIEIRLYELMESHLEVNERVKELAKDVLQREIYQSADDRHHLAIKDAKEGRSLTELVQKHGLSSDEAALIIALHTQSFERKAGKRLLDSDELVLSSEVPEQV